MHQNTKIHNMIESQLKPNNIVDENLLSAFAKINQENFLPQNYSNQSYVDDHIVINNSRFLLKPLIIAKLISVLKISKEEHLLEIGTSIGYTTSILANFSNNIFTVEHDESFYSLAINNFKKNKINNIKIFLDNYANLKAVNSLFDKIIINGSVNKDPLNIINKLKINGKLACIYKNGYSSNLCLYTKTKNNFEKIIISNASAPLLINYIDKENFSF